MTATMRSEKSTGFGAVAVVSMLIVGIDAVSFGALIPMLAFIVLHFGASPALVTQFVAFAGLAAAAAGPLLGRASDRYGRTRVLLVTLMGSILAQLGMVLSWSLVGFFVFRTLSGLVSGRAGIVRAWATDSLPPAEHMKLISALATTQNIGTILGPVIGGIVASLFAAGEPRFKGVLWFAAALPVLSFALTVLFVRGAASGTRPVHHAQRNAGLQLTRTLLAPLVVIALTCYAVGVLLSTTALLVHQRFGWDEVATAWMMGFSATVMIGSRMFVLPRLQARFGAHRALIGALVVGAPSLVLMGFASRPELMIAGLGVLCVCLSITSVVPHVVISMNSEPARRGEAMGWAQCVTALGTAISASANGPLFAYVDPGMPHVVGALALGMAVLVVIFAWPRSSSSAPV